MDKKFLRKLIFTLVIVGIGVFSYLQKRLPLGIDLAGGAEMLYALNDEDLKQELAVYTDYLKKLSDEAYAGNLQKKLTDAKAKLATVTDPKETVIIQHDIDGLEMQLNKRLLEDRIRTVNSQLGGATTQEAADVIRKRINPTGTREVLVTSMGSNRIRIQLPFKSRTDLTPEEAEAAFQREVSDIKSVIEKTGSLSFHLVVSGGAHAEDIVKEAGNDYKQRISPPIGYLYGLPEEEYRAMAKELEAQGKPMPLGYLEIKEDRKTAKNPEHLLLDADNKGLTGSIVASAYTSMGDEGMQVNMDFTADGSQLFGRFTDAHVGDRLAIVLDGIVQSSPTIRSRISGSGRITGNFTEQEASGLSIVLKSGRLPMKVKFESLYVVGPSLGKDSIDKGILSVALGSVLVLLFMLFYYRVAGLIADIALVLNIAMIIGAMSLMNATLTLPGIAGLLLTIGMAVDANILIFERLREEKARGRNLEKALDAGFDRAFVTIVDSNLTTLIAAIALYEFGTGPVRGFAVTLTIGLLANLFTALYVSKFILEYIIVKGVVKEMNMRQIVHNPKIQFMSMRLPMFILSGLLVAASLFIFFAYPNKYGIDFMGGTLVQVKSANNVTLTADELRSAAEECAALVAKENNLATTGAVQVQSFEESSITGGALRRSVPQFTLTTVLDGKNVEQMKKLLQDKLAGKLADEPYPRTTSIGANAAKDLGRAALLAIGVSLLLVFFYIVLRFDFSAAFGFGAIISLFHDVSIATGAMLLMDWLGWMEMKIDLPIIAALLTILGYSLNDTIVIYDRIRENRANLPNMPLPEVIDLSVNQTLSRTLLTSFTVLMTVLVLFFLGGGMVHSFSFVFLVGTIVGVYSSVFIAAPIVVSFYKKRTEIAKIL